MNDSAPLSNSPSGSSLGSPSGNLNSSPKTDPLAILLSSTGADRVAIGEDFSLGVTITNRGDLSAAIDVWIEEVSPPLLQWLSNPRQSMALARERSGEVRFDMHVPAGVLLGTYRYRLIIDAQEAYPEDTPISRELSLQVVQPLQAAAQSTDPTFSIQPTSRSDRPFSLQPGGAIALQVMVHNRSQQVDRFRLTCRDCPLDWVEISYPREETELGEIEIADSLPLNPGERGSILVTLAPSLEAIAGSYIPTLQLHSEANTDLALLEPVYLQVLPSYSLQANIFSLHTNVGSEPGRYRIDVTNDGNSDRHILLAIAGLGDRTAIEYDLETEELHLAPKQTRLLPLEVRPTGRRPFWGGGRLYSFTVDLDDPDRHPVTTPRLPATLLWTARPWWHLLPLALLVLVVLATLALLILRWFVFPPPSPTILDFAASDTRLAVANGDVVRLGWQIDRPDRIRELEILGRAPDGTVASEPVRYSFAGGVPEELEAFCAQDRDRLSCAGVRTDARRAGDYVFELTVTPRKARRSRSQTQQTEQISIAPPPRITDFSTDRALYEAQLPDETVVPEPTAVPEGPEDDQPTGPEIAEETGIALNWSITRPEQIQDVRAIVRIVEGEQAGEPVGEPLRFSFREGVPDELEEECTVEEQLVCQNVPTGIRTVGDYTIELQVSPGGVPGSQPRSRRIGPVAIAPPPEIVTFTVNGDPVPPKILLPIEDGILPAPLALDWEATGSEGTNVQLLPSPGDVPLSGSLRLPLSPSPTTTTLMLQVTSPTGTQVVQAVAIETFDPTPDDPESEGEGSAGDPLSAPAPADPNTLSPLTFPPRFD
ncbi:MAG: hypothetical protein AB4050_10025 [Synechococcus sp.]